jgi:hypothetical protein
MSTHEDRHIDFVLEVIEKLARKHGVAGTAPRPEESLDEAAALAMAVC